MNAATYEKSKRLQSVVEFFTAGGINGRWATTAEIQHATGSMAVHSDIAEIRAQADRLGLVVPPARYHGLTHDRRKIYEYLVCRKDELVSRGKEPMPF